MARNRPHPSLDSAPGALCPLLLVLLLLVLVLPNPTTAAHQCSDAEGGGTCPDLGTCCPLSLLRTDHDVPVITSACLPHNPHLGSGPGVCCGGVRSNGGGGGGGGGSPSTGCPPGYRCAAAVDRGGTIREYCRRAEDEEDDNGVPVPTTGMRTKKERVKKAAAGRGGKRRRKNPSLSSSTLCRGGRDVARPPELPRYALCSGSAAAAGVKQNGFDVLYGFPVRRRRDAAVAATMTTGSGPTSIETRRWELAYHSNMGPITTRPTAATANADGGGGGSDQQSQVRHVVVVIHGSARNADEYLCSTSAASTLQRRFDDPTSSVLVVAPRFLAVEDGPMSNFVPSDAPAAADDDDGATNGGTNGGMGMGANDEGLQVLPLRWNETWPIPHTWRYGANSIEGDVSSYDAVDALVEHFVLDGYNEEGKGEKEGQRRYPNLESVVVAGHSAGGQLVQRWAMLSSSAAWGDGGDGDGGGDDSGDDSGDGTTASTAKMRKWRRKRRLRRTKEHDRRGGAAASSATVRLWSVAANPRSFCYLDGRRYRNGTLGLPTDEEVRDCPGYDQWEWGLQNGGPISAPYKDEAIYAAGGTNRLVQRYLRRDVVYLAGAMDLLPLQGSCEDDDFQGSCRLERSALFYDSLNETEFGGAEVVSHRRLVVDGVGHDHTFMFQSPAGLSALFCPPGVEDTCQT